MTNGSLAHQLSPSTAAIEASLSFLAIQLKPFVPPTWPEIGNVAKLIVSIPGELVGLDLSALHKAPVVLARTVLGLGS